MPALDAASASSPKKKPAAGPGVARPRPGVWWSCSSGDGGSPKSSFFALFLYFLVQTAFRGGFVARADTPVRLPLPVEGFLLVDPFVAAMTLLSTHTLYRSLIWSLGLLAITLVFGRVFCGWICPFGTLHHFFGWLIPSKRGRGAARVDANRTHTYQRVKYYLLYAFLVAGLAGSAIGGLFDPICIAVRSIGLGVIPAAQYISHRALGAAQDIPSRPIQSLADHSAGLARRRPSGRRSSFTFIRHGSSFFCLWRCFSRTGSFPGSGAVCSARWARFSASSRASPCSG